VGGLASKKCEEIQAIGGIGKGNDGGGRVGCRGASGGEAKGEEAGDLRKTGFKREGGGGGDGLNRDAGGFERYDERMEAVIWDGDAQCGGVVFVCGADEIGCERFRGDGELLFQAEGEGGAIVNGHACGGDAGRKTPGGRKRQENALASIIVAGEKGSDCGGDLRWRSVIGKGQIDRRRSAGREDPPGGIIGEEDGGGVEHEGRCCEC